jgi:hypothetical protein
MGDVADMMLDGTLCEGCGVFLNDDPPWYPCYCKHCGVRHPVIQQLVRKELKKRSKVKCPTCDKMVAAEGMADHKKMKHQIMPTRTFGCHHSKDTTCVLCEPVKLRYLGSTTGTFDTGLMNIGAFENIKKEDYE